MSCRVLKSGKHRITSPYGNRAGGYHHGVDIVKHYSELDYIIAHSDGKVIACQDGLGNMKGSNSYGNYVKIDHGNGIQTLYAHLEKGLKVAKGNTVKKGQVIGYMGNSGDSNGGHLHFEVWQNGTRINPTPYLEKDLPGATVGDTSSKVSKYKEGDTVTINGVYVSSTSDTRLTPLKTKGKITDIKEGARNPYLLEDGNIGWVNDDCIVSKVETIKYMTVCNCSWLNLRTSAGYGNNIYKAVKAGTKVEYHGIYNGWARIKYEGKTLYCGKSYLK